jgi:hypothetical protein
MPKITGHAIVARPAAARRRAGGRAGVPPPTGRLGGQPNDLPPECRTVSRRLLSPLESMERNAIVQSLLGGYRWVGAGVGAAGSTPAVTAPFPSPAPAAPTVCWTATNARPPPGCVSCQNNQATRALVTATERPSLRCSQ